MKMKGTIGILFALLVLIFISSTIAFSYAQNDDGTVSDETAGTHSQSGYPAVSVPSTNATSAPHAYSVDLSLPMNTTWSTTTTAATTTLPPPDFREKPEFQTPAFSYIVGIGAAVILATIASGLIYVKHPNPVKSSDKATVPCE